MIDQSSESKAHLFLNIEQSLGFCSASLKKMLLTTMIILKKLPLSTIDFYVDNKSQAISGQGLTFADCAAQMVLKSWHAKITPTISVETSPAVAEIRGEASSALSRRGQFFQPVLIKDNASSVRLLGQTSMAPKYTHST